jgi:hypothetical protein
MLAEMTILLDFATEFKKTILKLQRQITASLLTCFNILSFEALKVLSSEF